MLKEIPYKLDERLMAVMNEQLAADMLSVFNRLQVIDGQDISS